MADLANGAKGRGVDGKEGIDLLGALHKHGDSFACLPNRRLNRVHSVGLGRGERAVISRRRQRQAGERQHAFAADIEAYTRSNERLDLRRLRQQGDNRHRARQQMFKIIQDQQETTRTQIALQLVRR